MKTAQPGVAMTKWNRYWYANCPRCRQYGLLLVGSLKATGQMCLHCDECRLYTLDPEALHKLQHSDLGIHFDPEATPGFAEGDLPGMFKAPMESEIDAAGWRKYCRGRTYEPEDYSAELTEEDDEEELEPQPRDPASPYYSRYLAPLDDGWQAQAARRKAAQQAREGEAASGPAAEQAWNRYWFGQCPRPRHVGLLLISSLKATGQMCLQCDRCLGFWLDPEQPRNFEQGDLGMFEAPAEEQIDRAGWRAYCKGQCYDPEDYGVPLSR